MRDGWREAPLGELFATTNDRLGEHEAEPEVLSVTKYDGVVRARDYFDKRIASARLDTYKVIAPDDWAYSTIHIDEGSIARNGLGVEGVVSPMYTTMRLISGDVLPYYCELALRAPGMLLRYRDAQQGSIDRRRSLPWKTFCALTIPVPPLQEQRRIVDLVLAVDSAALAAEQARAALLVLQTQLRNRALAAPSVPVGRVLRAVESGTSTKPVDGDGPRRNQLTLAAIRPGVFHPEAVKDVGPANLPERARLRDGDLLITRSNTPERVGYVAMATDVPPDTYIPDLVWRLVPDETAVSREFLAEYLSSPTMRAKITASASGTSESMRKINKTTFASLPLPLPSLAEQETYLAPLRALRQARTAQEITQRRLVDLRANLLTALLSGEHEVPDTYDELLAG